MVCCFLLCSSTLEMGRCFTACSCFGAVVSHADGQYAQDGEDRRDPAKLVPEAGHLSY